MIGLIRITNIFIIILLLLPVSLFAQKNFTSSNIPIVVIETNTLEIVDEYRIVANMGIIDNGEGSRNSIYNSFNDYYGEINIEFRGSTSQSFPKKSYGFETQDSNNNSINVSLLNLPIENDWVLYAPYSDKSLIRNILSYKLSSELGHYAPRTKLCELILNGEYKGVYVLIEKIKRDKNRVDISKLKSDEISGDDLTGGYIIKIDKLTGNSGSFWQSELGGIYFQFEYPKHDTIAPEQKEYIKSYIDSFEQALSSEYFMDLDTGYRKYIDINSFVDYFIVNELAKNIDGYFLSTYFYKDKDSKGGKLNFGPVWDFNLAFGNANYREGYMTNGFQVNVNSSPWWWDRLLQDSVFKTAISNRWCSIRESKFSDNALIILIDSLSLLLDEAQERNFTKWNILNHYVWPNYYVGKSYENEIDYLKTWTLNRLHWLDDSLFCENNNNYISADYETNVYPNPFSNSLSYDFSLYKSGNISLIIYDIYGIQIAAIIDKKYYPTGKYTIDWISTKISSSIYFIALIVDGEIVSRKRIVKLM